MCVPCSTYLELIQIINTIYTRNLGHYNANIYSVNNMDSMHFSKSAYGVPCKICMFKKNFYLPNKSKHVGT